MPNFFTFLLIILFLSLTIISLKRLKLIRKEIAVLTDEVLNLSKLLKNSSNATVPAEQTIQTNTQPVENIAESQPIIESKIVELTPAKEEISKTDNIEPKVLEDVSEPDLKPKTDNITIIDESKVQEEISSPFTHFLSQEKSASTESESLSVDGALKESDVPEKSYIEKISGDNWLSKIGIVTLVLGIAFFIKYAIDQEWINEIGRVGIGLFTGALIIGIAHKLKSKYQTFSSILVGGGISVFYITITLAFREYEIFSQTTTFILLIIVTIFSVLLSLLYDRKELAIFSLLGGFASPLIASSGTGNYIVLFSYILILNTGMLVISLMKKWRVIGIICYVLTFVFLWGWLVNSFKNQFTGATIFTVLFFLQFYILAIIDHFRSEKKVTNYQSFLILTNNTSVFFASLYIFSDYSYNVSGIITLIIAAANAFIMLVLFKNNKIDHKLIYLIIAIIMTLVSLAIPIQLHGHVITMFWAAEAVLLLWLWQRSKINIFRIGFLSISILTLLSYAIDVSNNYTYNTSLTIIANRICITGIVVIISFIINSFLLKKEDPTSRINIKNINLVSVSTLVKTFTFIIIVLVFLVPYLEVNYQLKRFTDTDITASFRYLSLVTYTMLFISVLSFIYRHRFTRSSLGYLFICICMYSIIYPYLIKDLRWDIFIAKEYTISYFFMHFLSIPAVVYAIYLVTKNKKLLQQWFTFICWTLVILSVWFLSIELENIVILLFGYKEIGNNEYYHSLLYDVHTFGYPILWGILAMILMIWGLKGKEVVLRKISLIFFGFIILKFYIYDVWYMSQAGRILSFVALGIILLLVSFLQQKIKILMKNDLSSSEDMNEK